MCVCMSYVSASGVCGGGGGGCVRCLVGVWLRYLVCVCEMSGV